MKAKRHLILVHDEPVRGPSERFLSLTRNIVLAKKPPERFEPTRKNPEDVVI